MGEYRPSTNTRNLPRDRTYRDVLQVQMFVVHRLTQLADPLLHLVYLFGCELTVGRFVLLELQQADHQLQTGPVQVHVQAVTAQDVHQRGRAKSQVLPGRECLPEDFIRTSLIWLA